MDKTLSVNWRNIWPFIALSNSFSGSWELSIIWISFCRSTSFRKFLSSSDSAMDCSWLLSRTQLRLSTSSDLFGSTITGDSSTTGVDCLQGISLCFLKHTNEQYGTRQEGHLYLDCASLHISHCLEPIYLRLLGREKSQRSKLGQFFFSLVVGF